MVLPTGDHRDLREWLEVRDISTVELGFSLVTPDLDALLELVDAPLRLDDAQRAVIALARTHVEPQGLMLWDCEELEAMRGLLEHVCAALLVAGLVAVPYEGLGIRQGNKLLSGQVVLRELDDLYARMHSDRGR